VSYYVTQRAASPAPEARDIDTPPATESTHDLEETTRQNCCFHQPLTVQQPVGDEWLCVWVETPQFGEQANTYK